MNISLLKSLCQISALVYKPNTFFIENYSKNPCIKGCECFKNIDKQPEFIESDINCQVYVSTFNKNSILCAFRGSQELRDWLTDANIIRVPMNLHNVNDDERPLVHWGILRQFRSVERNITEYIDNELKDNEEIENIIYTGHSLGGGLASIALMSLSHKYPSLKHQCVTFGAPRVGNNHFRNLFIKKCDFSKRYVNYNDPVPSLPFSLRYNHSCPEEHIHTLNNVTIIQQAETPISRFFWILYHKFAHWCFGVEYNPIDDHSIQGYYEKLCDVFDEDEDEEIETKNVTLQEKK